MPDNTAVPIIAGLAVGISVVILFAWFGDQVVSNRSVYRGLYMAEVDGSKIAISPITTKEVGCPNCIVLTFMDEATYIRETGKSVVKAEFLAENITLQRGSHADVPLLIKHMGGVNSEPFLIVTVMPPTGYTLYPKSIAETTTEEQRFEAAKAGTPLEGGIDIARFVIPGSPINIQVGNQQVVNVRFVVPEDIPDEADGAFVPVRLDVKTPSIATQDSVYDANAGIDLIIVHS